MYVRITVGRQLNLRKPGKLGQSWLREKERRCGVRFALENFEARLARIPEQRFNLALLALYILVTSVTMSAHEMFRDEIQAWLIARDSHGIADLIHNLKYEGHPALWYLFLLPLTRIGREPQIMQGLQLAIASATVGVVLFR